MANFKPAKIKRSNAEPMSDVLRLFVAVNHLGAGLYRKAVFDAWDEASSAARYSNYKFLKDGVLYVTVSSSLVRSQLMFQKDVILKKMNGILANSETARLSGFSEGVKDIKLR